MEFYQKILYLRVTHCAFIALQKFYSDHCLKYFCEFPNNISFSFLLQKNKPTQSATIVITLWIYRTEDKLQSCILVWRDSKKRCVHCNQPIVRPFGRYSCVASATVICILHIVESFRSYSTIDQYLTSFPRNQKQQCRNRPQKIYDRDTFDKSAEKIDGRVLVLSPMSRLAISSASLNIFF